MKILKYFFEALFIYFFFFIIFLVGLNFGRKIFSRLFNLIGPYYRSNQIIKSNLLKIDKSINENQISKFRYNMWSNYGKNFVEYLFLKKFKNKNDHIVLNDNGLIKKITSSNKPVIFVSGHFANFELMSMELVKRNIKLATIYRPLNNIFINPIMEKIRRTNVCQNQIKKGLKGIRDVYKYLNNGFSIALMIDQRISEGEQVKLFNEDALTTTLPAQLALRFDCDIFPLYIRRDENDLFFLEFENPLMIKDLKAENLNKVQITEKLNKILEKMIKRDPGQWILTHNRWK